MLRRLFAAFSIFLLLQFSACGVVEDRGAESSGEEWRDLLAGGKSPAHRDSPNLTQNGLNQLFAEQFSVTQVTINGQKYPPLPTTNIDSYTLSTGVSAVYSPSAVLSPYLANVLLAAGESIHCQSATVARDSIFLALGGNGVNFNFHSHFVEPASYVCSRDKELWPSGTVFQVNDPSILLRTINGVEYLYMLYTSAVWKTLKTDARGTRTCGEIGIVVASVNDGIRTIFRNDHLLRPTASDCYTRIVPKLVDGVMKDVDVGLNGYSRPEFKEESTGTYSVVFDADGRAASIPLTGFDTLSPTKIEFLGVNGVADILGLKIANFDVLLLGFLSNNVPVAQRGLRYTSSPYGKNQWATFRTGLTNVRTTCPHGWDCSGHASPGLMVTPKSYGCRGYMYFAGGEANTGEAAKIKLYESISLAVGVQPSNALGNALCGWR